MSFKERPFNDVDNLVLCYISYAVLKGLATEEENSSGVTVKEYYSRLLEKGGYKTDLDIYASEAFLKKASSSVRFGSVLIKDYVDIIDEETSMQFSAMTFVFDDDKSYIAFRGTDDTIIGWKEDFMISYTRVKAQDMALEYLNRHIVPGMEFYVGGHSKGGNLSIYSTANLSDEKLSQVKRIYTNDGPGLCQDVFNTKKLQRIESRSIKITPEYSVIGMLFSFNCPNHKIVSSHNKGLLQHDLLSWCVSKDELVLAPKMDPEASSIDDTVSMWLSNMTQEQKEDFTHDIFDAVSLGGKVSSVSGFKSKGLKGVQEAFVKLSLKQTSSRKKMLRLPLTIIFGKKARNLRYTKPVVFLTNNPIPLGVFMIVIGLLFLLLPKEAIPLIVGIALSIVTAFELFLLIYFLYLTHWDFQHQIMRVYVFIFLMILTVSIFINPSLFSSVSSMLFGTGSLIYAFTLFGKSLNFHKSKDRILMVACIFESLGLLALGIYFICLGNLYESYINPIIGIGLLAIGGYKVFFGLFHLIRGALASRPEIKD
ncbi:MAG: Mbeg1-like protein [Bacilli bacterium]